MLAINCPEDYTETNKIKLFNTKIKKNNNGNIRLIIILPLLLMIIIRNVLK